MISILQSIDDLIQYFTSLYLDEDKLEKELTKKNKLLQYYSDRNNKGMIEELQADILYICEKLKKIKTKKQSLNENRKN